MIQENTKRINNQEEQSELRVEKVGMEYSLVTVDEKSEKLIIDLEYPVFDGGGNLSPYINKHISTFVDQLKSDFVDDFNSMEHEYDLAPWFLEINTIITRNDLEFISLVLEGNIYYGGAHPNWFYKTFLFNLEEGGSVMNIADIFNPSALVTDEDSDTSVDWLHYISEKTRLQLMQKEFVDAEWINEGAGPNYENFENFYFTDKNLIIVFPPYQVAPYAAGPQEAVFTIDELAEYLRAYNF